MNQLNHETIRHRHRWDSSQIIDEIKKLTSFSPRQVQILRPSLYGAAIRHFDTWRAAVEAAGYRYPEMLGRRQPGYWSHQRIIALIRKLECRHSNHVRNHETALYSAALRLFGAWKCAIEAAGFDYASIHRGWIASDNGGLRFRRNALV